MKKFTLEIKQKIEARVETLERETCVEVVPVFSERSSRYFIWKALYSVFVFGFTLTALTLHWEGMDANRKVLAAILVGALAFALLSIDWIFRFFVPAVAKLHEVEEKAHSLFLHQEIFETKNRLGILIFVSEFERAVFVLADKGFDGKVASKEWSELGLTLAKDFGRRTRGETFLNAMDHLALRLAKDFPPSMQPANQLKNDLREV